VYLSSCVVCCKRPRLHPVGSPALNPTRRFPPASHQGRAVVPAHALIEARRSARGSSSGTGGSVCCPCGECWAGKPFVSVVDHSVVHTSSVTGAGFYVPAAGRAQLQRVRLHQNSEPWSDAECIPCTALWKPNPPEAFPPSSRKTVKKLKAIAHSRAAIGRFLRRSQLIWKFPSSSTCSGDKCEVWRRP